MEIWKDIPNYEELYQVSNLGRVQSLHYRHSDKTVILSAGNCKGYLRVPLSKNGKTVLHHIHRLVAEAFIPNPDNLPEVNHIDENKSNNCVENLEWCNHRYNSRYGTRIQRESISHINHPKLSKQVLCIETNIIYQSVHEAERQTGIGFSEIASVCRGFRNRQTAGGFHWKYVE